MIKKSKSLYIKVLVLLELFLVIVCIFQSMFHKIEPNTNFIENSVDMTKGWVDDDGNDIVLEPLLSNKSFEFGKENRMYYKIGKDIKPGYTMCFRSLSTNFKAYIGDKLIIKPRYYKSKFSCESTGSQWHFYTFTEEDMGKTIEVKLTFFYKDSASYFENMRACNAWEYVINAIDTKLSEIIIALAIVVIGIFLIVIGVYSRYNLNLSQHTLITLGMFACILGTWTLLESHIIELLFNVSQYVQIMACNMLLILPIGTILLLGNIFDSRLQKWIDRTCLFDTVIFIIAWILQITGIQDFHDTLYLTFVSIIASSVMVVVIAILEYMPGISKKTSVVVAIVKKNNNGFKIYALIGLLICLLVDFIAFFVNPQNINGMFSRWSSLYAIGLCLILAIKNIVLISQEYNHATAIGKVALQDVLTGLANRTAYKEKVDEITMDHNLRRVGVVVFDVNNLKYVNDNLGHNYGDELIMAAASVLKEVYQEMAIVYRIGGDEFVALIETDDITTAYKMASIQLKNMVHNYNNTCDKPYRLSIAEGMALYDASGQESLVDVIEKADKRMYVNKQEYKKTHPIVENVEKE